MGWSFRRSIKIAPGVRINLSKSGVSTSIGGKGFTYNTRGRLTTSIPGTGIRHTQNLNVRRTATPNRSAVAASKRIDSAGTAQLSKREQASRDFVAQVQDRTTKVLRQYFITYGVYVVAKDLAEAVALEDHQEFLGSLTREFEVTTKAIKLAIDIGSISLAEKEKAMLALYEIERKCEDHQGDRSELEDAATSLRNKVRAWPALPSFVGPFLVSLLGCLLLSIGNFTFGSILIVGSAAYGIFKLKSFEKKKALVLDEIVEADAKFDSLVTCEISPRPTVLNPKDSAQVSALMLAGITMVLALIAVVYYSQSSERSALISSENSNPVDNSVQSDAVPALPNSASPSKSSLPTLQASFDCTKARSNVERMICGDRELAADDLELASIFSKAKAAATNRTAFKERARKAWNYREKNCHDRDCVVRWYVDQKAALLQIVETGNVETN